MDNHNGNPRSKSSKGASIAAGIVLIIFLLVFILPLILKAGIVLWSWVLE